MNATTAPEVGTTITFNRPTDSFFVQATGIVLSVKGEWVQVQAFEGRERFARQMSAIDCGMSCKIKDILARNN